METRFEICSIWKDSVLSFLFNYTQCACTQAEAKAEVENICGILGSLKDECDKLVDQYFDAIWQELVNNADPDTVCSTIGLCSSKSPSFKVQRTVLYKCTYM